MPVTSPREVTLDQFCPGCYDEGKDNPLKNVVGTYGTFCVGADGFSRPHFYDDTGTLRLLIKKMNEKRSLALKREAPPTPAAVEVPEEEKVSVIEPAAFQITEMDAARLSELLGQPIRDAGTLVGVLWTLKNEASAALTEDTRTQVATQGQGMPEIRQRADGGLALQVFFPWKVGWQLADKATFNGISVTRFAQDQFEYIASGNYFPTSDIPDYPEVDPRAEGYWVLINVPEMYVGSMIEKAANLGVTTGQYLQNFFFWMIESELFP